MRRGAVVAFSGYERGRAGAEALYRKLGYSFVGNIPDYAANPDGSLAANAIFFKRLGGAAKRSRGDLGVRCGGSESEGAAVGSLLDVGCPEEGG